MEAGADDRSEESKQELEAWNIQSLGEVNDQAGDDEKNQRDFWLAAMYQGRVAAVDRTPVLC
jgi:hypothetical protein